MKVILKRGFDGAMTDKPLLLREFIEKNVQPVLVK
jgi:hypothetical protein